jgi:hypothetical protein
MCVLRVAGSKFDVEAFLRTSEMHPAKVFRAADPRSPSRSDGALYSTSGFSVAVSDADWSNLPEQVADACAFLERHAHELRALAGLETVENLRLDFPVELRMGRKDVVVQFNYLPPELIKLAGALGMGIEVSMYPGEEEKDGE